MKNHVIEENQPRPEPANGVRPGPASRAVGLVPLLAAAAIHCAPARAAAGYPRASRACTPSESWTFAPEIGSNAREAFGKTIHGGLAPIQGFAEGLALSRGPGTARSKLFGEYWKNRALLQGRLVSAALDGFGAIAASSPSLDTVGIQIAAIGCLNRIHDRYPALPVPPELRGRLSELYELAPRGVSRQPLWEMTTHLILLDLADGAPRSDTEALAGLLAGTGNFEAFAKGFIAAARGDHAQTISWLGKVLGTRNIHDHKLPDGFRRDLPHARMLLARAYYATHQYDRAIAQYNLVERSSNETPEMIQELAWSYLMEDHYAGAVGAAVNLQVGQMKTTFTPEAPSVMAMALNELCQYPDSLRAVQLYRRDYEPSHEWLANWSRNPSQPLYGLAIGYLQGHDAGIPARIAGEWIRSTLFISHQQEIHRLFGERERTQEFVRGGLKAQTAIAADIHDRAGSLNVGVRQDAGGVLGIYSADKVPPRRAADLETLKAAVDAYNHLREADAYLQPILADLETRAGSIRARLVREIDADLARRTARMLKQLNEVTENSRLIEVEIFNGASHDMIWRNAHPDYAEIERKMKVAYGTSRGGTLNWGTINPTAGKVEVWEDELGSFKANLHDNCSSKERYLALKNSR